MISNYPHKQNLLLQCFHSSQLLQIIPTTENLLDPHLGHRQFLFETPIDYNIVKSTSKCLFHLFNSSIVEVAQINVNYSYPSVSTSTIIQKMPVSVVFKPRKCKMKKLDIDFKSQFT